MLSLNLQAKCRVAAVACRKHGRLKQVWRGGATASPLQTFAEAGLVRQILPNTDAAGLVGIVA